MSMHNEAKGFLGCVKVFNNMNATIMRSIEVVMYSSHLDPLTCGTVF